MIAVVEAEAVTAAPELRGWFMSLAAFARRAADRHVGVGLAPFRNSTQIVAPAAVRRERPRLNEAQR
jgi:hypothetical protein